MAEIHNSTSKSARIIEAFEGILSAQMIFFNKELKNEKSLINEIKTWSPKIDSKDDGLDSISGLVLNKFASLNFKRTHLRTYKVKK